MPRRRRVIRDETVEENRLGPVASSEPPMNSMGWQQPPQAGPPPPHQGAQQLSVVTTVWGVTTSTQSGPLSHTAYTGNPGNTMTQPTYQQSQHSYPAGPGNMPAKAYLTQGMPPRQAAPSYPSYNPSGGTMTGHGTPPDFQAPSAALSAAALVAAATATATATASVVALQERQPQEVCISSQYGQVPNMQSQQYPPGYGAPGPQRMHSGVPMGTPMAPMGNPSSSSPMSPMTVNCSMTVTKSAVQSMQGVGGPGQAGSTPMYPCGPTGMASHPRGRPVPYPSPQQYLAQKRQAQYSNTGTPQYNPSMQSYSPNTQQTYAANQQYAGNQFTKGQQQYNSPMPQMGPQQTVPTSFPVQQQQLRPTGRPQAPPYGGQQYFQQGQMNGSLQYEQQYANNQYNPQNFQRFEGAMTPQKLHPGYGTGEYPATAGGNSIQRNLNYQHSPIPGNPTPPLTPASSVPPYLSPNSDVKPTFQDLKPPLPPPKDEELRLTFPVRDGIILAPFRLEHNLAVSNHVFHLKPSVHQTLMWRSDLELQLKCFHHEDRQMNTNWPASVQVSVNATPLTIDRGENKTSHKPLYLKEVCQPGRNTIQITVTACCCSHLFLLQLVHRPTVRSVLQGLLRKRLLPAEHCVAKIKRNFTNAAASGNNPVSGEDGVEQTAIKVSLKCPITFKRITLPARGQECRHVQCFDLESYLQLNCERGSWRCPVCNKPALLEGLEVDQYMWGILTNLSNSDVEEVTIDASASWKPAPLKSIKEEHDGHSCGGQQCYRAMSPGSMHLPTTSSWEMGQGLSPYPNLLTPDMPSMAGPVVNGPPGPNGGYGGNPGGGMEFPPHGSDFGSPLSHLSESVASLDPLAAMEKSLSHHEQQMGVSNVHEPHPSSGPPIPDPNPGPPPTNPPLSQHGPHTPGAAIPSPASLPPPSSQSSSTNDVRGDTVSESSLSQMPDGSQSSAQTPGGADSLSQAPDLSDLNFDPAAVIDGEGQGQEGLNLLPDGVVDPMELLSYLDPPGVGGGDNDGASGGCDASGASGRQTGSSSSASDDLLALFES